MEEYAACIKKLLIEQNLYEEMSKNCKEKIVEFSSENTIAQFDGLIEKLYDANITVNKNQNISKRIQAIFYFVFVFAVISLKQPLIKSVFRCYKKKNTFINAIKLLYHFSLFLVNPFLIPFKFIIGFTVALFLGY
jgi:hypothetical protein